MANALEKHENYVNGFVMKCHCGCVYRGNSWALEADYDHDVDEESGVVSLEEFNELIVWEVSCTVMTLQANV